MSLTVIKLGGSLMRSKLLPVWLEHIESLANKSDVIVVPGGGEFADLVRGRQDIHQFNDEIAHKMALLAMNQYGYLLAGMHSKLQIVEDREELTAHLGKNLPIIWLPTALLDDDSEIPANWDYTADSIALWLAGKIAAEKLILVKSILLDNDKSLLINHINDGYLDKGFQYLINDYSGKILFMAKEQYQLLND